MHVHADGSVHHHDHGHGHSHAPANFNRAFAIGVALNVAFVVAEVVYGLSANSLALVSDAGHNLSDVLGLLLAWAALRLSRARPTARRTYGYQRTSILAAVANASMLLFVTGGVTWEAVLRFRNPEPVVATTIIVVAAVGIVVNGVSAMLFFSGRATDVNIRGAFMHLAGDALVAAGVVIAGVIIRMTDWLWLDPVVSILIGIVITIGTWGLLRESMNLVLDAVPSHIDPAAVENFLAGIEGVAAVHDLHIWGMSTSDTALTAHLVIPGGDLNDARMASITETLRSRFNICHATIQLEHSTDAHPGGMGHEAPVARARAD